MRLRLLFAVVLAGPANAAMAQEALWPPEPGTPVRVTYLCARPGLECRFEGPLLVVTPDSLVIRKGGADSRHALSGLSRLEVSQGRKSHWLLGAGAGFLVGAGATYLILQSGGSTSPCDRDANQDAMSSGECAGLTILGGVVGAGLGAAIGSLIHSERWRDVPVERFRVGIGPGLDGRLTVRVAGSFAIFRQQ